MQTLTAAMVRRALPELPGWRYERGRLWWCAAFRDFPEAMRFVNRVARLAERVAHHPHIQIEWNRVTLMLVTHEAGGVTEKDLALARELGWMASRRWRRPTSRTDRQGRGARR